MNVKQKKIVEIAYPLNDDEHSNNKNLLSPKHLLERLNSLYVVFYANI